jgi:hypothetical protein
MKLISVKRILDRTGPHQYGVGCCKNADVGWNDLLETENTREYRVRVISDVVSGMDRQESQVRQ